MTGILIALGSKALDLNDAIELGLPADAWLIIGLVIFFIAIVALLLQYQKQSLVIIKGATLEPPQSKLPQSEAKAQSHEYNANSYIRGRVIYLMDLLAPSSKPIISDRTIEDCEVRGPAMVAFLGNVTITNSGFEGEIDSLFVEIADKRMIFGAIGLLRCTFRRCQFKGIGILGTKKQIQKARQGFSQSASHKGGCQPE